MNYRKGEIDHLLLVAVLLLAGYGFVMSYSVSDYLISGNSALFRSRDFKQPAALAQKISQGREGVPALIKSRLPASVLYQLGHYGSLKKVDADSLKKILSEALNPLLLGGGIYDDLAFKDVKISKAAAGMLAQNPEGEELVKLNRMLLQSAFPREIRGRSFYYRLGILKGTLWRFLAAALAFIAAFKINYRKVRHLIGPVFMVLLLILYITPFAARAVRGAKSWFLGVQPAEFAKFFLVLFLADFMARRGEKMKSLKQGFFPVLACIVLVCASVLLQPDFGSTLVIAVLGLLLIYLGGVNQPAWFAVLGLGMAVFAGLALKFSHVKNRLAGFWWASQGSDELSTLFHLPSSDFQSAVSLQFQKMLGHVPSPQELGGFKNALSQTYQSLLGIGSGGLLGVGMGQSRQKLLFLPEAHTDFIFSIIAEEGGLLIAAAVLVLFWVILWRGIKMARQMPEAFESYLMLGLSLGIFIQAAVNIMVATGLFPITGIPLPFLSFGGSALLVNGAAAGLMLNLSRYRADRPGAGSDWRKDETFDSRRRNRRASLSRAGGSR
jgi:cell division protein FtsW